MDANRLKVLQDIDYRVVRTCGNCRFSDFGPTAFWGRCSKFAFQVLKHLGAASDEAQRGLSVRYDGVCPQHDQRSTAVERLRGYQELLEKK